MLNIIISGVHKAFVSGKEVNIVHMIGQAHHYGCTVKDIETTLPFYRDTLGLEVISRGHVKRGSADAEKFSSFARIEDVDVEVVFLDAGGCQIELLQYNPSGENMNESASNNDPGASHFCFQVEDIDALHQELSNEGVDFISDPVTLSKGVRIAYLYDPEGNIIELSERDVDY